MRLFNDYSGHKEKGLKTDFIKHQDLLGVIAKHKHKKLFMIRTIGKSVEGREIYSISFGKGRIKILAWSQMHGDEPTATTALFDLLNFFSDNAQDNKIRDNLLNKITFCFIPILNPDGAEKFSRGNAFQIDLNRDTIRLQSPESKLLWKYANMIKPQFAFNLHDQNGYYTVGRTRKSTGISLLAPPLDHNNKINSARKKSMQLICKINETLSKFIPNHIARYNDDHEPRSFGDNFTKKGISSILIESGFIIGETDKENIRKLNFVALLSAFQSIAKKDYERVDHKKYFQIPENKPLLFDLLLKNLTLNFNGINYTVDIGINLDKFYDQTKSTFYYKSKIVEIGDLSIYNGIGECDLSGHEIESAKIYDRVYKSTSNVSSRQVLELLKKGYGYLRILNRSQESDYTHLPINIIFSRKKNISQIALEESANLIIKKNKKIIFVVINGFFFDFRLKKKSILNGLIID